MEKISSSKPYLIPALYQWLVDNHLTPYILVNAEYPGVEVPQEHVNAGRIVLNVSPEACRALHIELDRIVFTARFSGVPTQIFVPPMAVLAIYAKENGRGMEFLAEEDNALPPQTPPEPKNSPPKINKKPALTLVKKD